MFKQYNNNQTTLSIPLEIKVNDQHIVRIISLFVDSIPDDLIPQRVNAQRGQRPYDPRLLLKMLLFGYLRNVTSASKLREMAEENIPMKWLIGDPDVTPSARTINRFRSSNTAATLIKQMFLHFRFMLQQLNLITDEALFIDGTKILADANKYSFVWRASVERYEPKLDQKANELFDELIQNNINLNVDANDPDILKKMESAASQLEQKVAELTTAIDSEEVKPGGSPNKRLRRKYKHYLHTLKKDLIPRKTKYIEARHLFGDRNSFSKTDHDATFMRMKEDPMMNGQLKPGYNVQIGTQCQYVLYYYVCQRPTDQRTLVPFLEQVDHHFNYIVADAGYGSESNYDYVIDEYEGIPLIPYTMYLKELSRKYRKDMSKRQNWLYEKTLDRYTDDHGVQFENHRDYYRTDKYGTTRHFVEYTAVNADTPELYYYANTDGGNLRRISVNPHWENLKNSVKSNLSADKTASIFAKRKFEVEPVFGNIKTNMNFMRFSVRGKRATSNEMGLVFMAANLKKLTKSLLNNDNLLVKFERFMALYLCTQKIDLAEKRKKIEHFQRKRNIRSSLFLARQLWPNLFS